MVRVESGRPYGLLGADDSGRSALLRRWAAEWPGAGLADPRHLHAARDHAVVLLDEPLAGLDDTGARAVTEQMRVLARQRPLVIGTCRTGLVRELCRTVGLVRDGEVIREGLVADLLPVRGYEVRVRGLLEPHWAEWFPGATLATGNGETRLCLGQPDQATLHGVLGRVRDLGMPVVAVTPLWPDLDEIMGGN